MTARTTETSGKGHAPRAKKSLGQHFLRREDICHRIAALIAPCAHDRIVEIGPGPGALTRAIEAAPHARLLLIEKDRHWAAERQRLEAQARKMQFQHPETGGYGADEEAAQAQALAAQGEGVLAGTLTREGPKVGRNDPCPCGSGKKYKQCHGKLD